MPKKLVLADTETGEFDGVVKDQLNTAYAVASGLLADRPAASADNARRLYYAEDVNGGTLYRSNGTSWVQLAAGLDEPAPFQPFARKPADTTVNDSTSFAADPHLSVSLDAEAVYEVSGLLIYSSSTTADIKVRLYGPAGATGSVVFNGMPTAHAGSNVYDSINVAKKALGESQNLGGAGTGTPVITAPFRGLIVTDEAGDAYLSWAQNTNEATDTVLYADSYLIAVRRL